MTTATRPASTDRDDAPERPEVVVVARGGGARSAAAQQLATAALPLAGPGLVPVVVDVGPPTPLSDVDVRRLVDHVHARVADGRWRVPSVLLLLDRAARPDGDGPPIAQRLASRLGGDVIAATTRIAPHVNGGITTLDGGTFVTVSPSGNLDPGPTAAGGLFPRPAWAQHAPTSAAFVGDSGLLDPIPAGVWIHHDPNARSPQQRLGRLAHGLPATPTRPVVLLGSPGGRPLDLPAVAAALTARAGLLDTALVVPFGVPLAVVGELAELLNRPLDSGTAMIVVDESGTPSVRTVGADGRSGWEPFAPWVRFEPGAPAPTVLGPRPLPDPGGVDVVLHAVPAGLWLREAGLPEPPPAVTVDPRTAAVEQDGMRLFVGDPDRPAGTQLMQAAAALMGRLEPAVRQGARIVLPYGPGAGVTPAVAPTSAAINATTPPAAVPTPSVAVSPPVEPAPQRDVASQLDPATQLDAATQLDPAAQLDAAAGDLPAASVSALAGRRPGDPDAADLALVRAALGPVYGRLSGRAAAMIAIEPGRAGAGPQALAEMVALSAVTVHAGVGTHGADVHGSSADVRARVSGALADERSGSALVRSAAAGARALATYRGVGFAVLDVDTLPEEGDAVSGPLFARLGAERPVAGPGQVVLAVRTSAVRRLGGLCVAGEPDLVVPPGQRFRVLAVEAADDAARLVLAADAGDVLTDAAWFDDRTKAVEGCPALPVWTALTTA